jgi:hypothetical protein
LERVKLSTINEKAKKKMNGIVMIENSKCFIKMENDNLIELNDHDFIEVRNGNEFHRIKLEVLIKTKTGEGNPAFAGMECRVEIVR